MRLEPPAPRSRVKHLPLSHCAPGGYAVVDLLFNVLPIVCGSSVFVFVLLCITLFPF